MPQFCANISTLFRELPLLERIGAAAKAGFDAIEIQFPYDQDFARLRDELRAHRMPLVLMNFPAGDLVEGGEGLAAVPGREAEFERALAAARAAARILGPRSMNLLAGRPDSRHARAACRETFANNLRKARELTREAGIRLLVEPINTVDLPGFFLHSSGQALELVQQMPEIDLFVQYDIYHMHMMGEDPLTRLPEIIDRIGHIQFSDAPGRTEPGLGSIDFERIFSLIDSLSYSGYVGAEYFPSVATVDTLDWLGRARANRAGRD